MLPPRGEHEQCLGEPCHGLVQQQLAQALAQRRASGLARHPDLVPTLLEQLLQPRQMRALARAVDAFERDEAAAPRLS
jgi:CRISPR/Cas system-associated endonuclease Cas1